MPERHSLLKRQIRRFLGDSFVIPEAWQPFIDAVNNAYVESDTDREMLERALELSSQELLQANSEMRAMFLAIPDLLFRIDHQGTILSFKAGSVSDLLVEPKRLSGKRIQDIPVKPVGDLFRDAIERVLREKTVVSLEYSLTPSRPVPPGFLRGPLRSPSRPRDDRDHSQHHGAEAGGGRTPRRPSAVAGHH